MMAEELLEELRRCGAQVEARGEMLHVEAPRGAVSPELVQSLRKLKPDLLRLVAPLAARTVGEALGGVSETSTPLLTAGVCAMRLEEFARAALVVEMWSPMLDEAVVFASDDARVDPGERRTVYRARELRVLLGLATPRELRRVHEAKRLFRGTITDASPAGTYLLPRSGAPASHERAARTTVAQAASCDTGQGGHVGGGLIAP
jgi:hypothetical protein